jgi:hypothetical protein
MLADVVHGAEARRRVLLLFFSDDEDDLVELLRSRLLRLERDVFLTSLEDCAVSSEVGASDWNSESSIAVDRLVSIAGSSTASAVSVGVGVVGIMSVSVGKLGAEATDVSGGIGDVVLTLVLVVELLLVDRFKSYCRT